MGGVFLNVDLGELPEADEPEALYDAAHVANVACGGHAGDAASMRRSIQRCMNHGCLVGAHPSYPDRAGFGRRRQAMEPMLLAAAVESQCRALRREAERLGARIVYVKPHGALYHAADEERAVARAVVDGALAALGRGVTLIGPAAPTVKSTTSPYVAVRGWLHAEAKRIGLRFAREGFADRGVDEEGRLLPRDRPGALVADPIAAAARAEQLVAAGAVDTVCVHGDTPGALAIADAVRAALAVAGT